MLLRNVRTGFVYTYSPALANSADFEVYVERPNTNPEKGIKFTVVDGGIGDEVCALYAACGLANAGHKVFFHSRRKRWIDVASHPGVEIVDDPRKLVVDVRGNHAAELSDGFAGKLKSRAHLYIENVANEYGIDACAPARPKEVEKLKRPLTSQYIVLAPMASKPNRSWPHWRALAEKIDRQIVVVGAGFQEKEIREEFSGLDAGFVLGAHPREVLALVAHAHTVVANDSGIAHIGGLMGARTVVLSAMFPGDYLFACAPTVSCLMPKRDCVGCFSAPESKFAPECATSCAALPEITVEQVLAQIEPKTKKRGK